MRITYWVKGETVSFAITGVTEEGELIVERTPAGFKLMFQTPLIIPFGSLGPAGRGSPAEFDPSLITSINWQIWRRCLRCPAG